MARIVVFSGIQVVRRFLRRGSAWIDVVYIPWVVSSCCGGGQGPVLSQCHASGRLCNDGKWPWSVRSVVSVREAEERIELFSWLGLGTGFCWDFRSEFGVVYGHFFVMACMRFGIIIVWLGIF